MPENQVAAMYSALAGAWGRQHWWPARSRFEVIVGAFLTQNTSWTNVELAMQQLHSARLLNLAGIRTVPLRRLEQLIRSSGYFRQKARRLKNFVRFLDKTYTGSLTKMFAQPTLLLREQLLSLNGVGPETADSILLYAGQHPSFVVDAYTKRIAERHGVIAANTGYEEIRALFEGGLAEAELLQESKTGNPGGASHSPSRMSMVSRSPVAQVFNEMHALLVGVGKKYCLKPAPKCAECPLNHLWSSDGQKQATSSSPASPQVAVAAHKNIITSKQ